MPASDSIDDLAGTITLHSAMPRNQRFGQASWFRKLLLIDLFVLAIVLTLK